MVKKLINKMIEIEKLNTDEVEFFINIDETKIIVKNSNKNYDMQDILSYYFNVKEFKYIQELQYLYSFKECEVIEVILK